MDKQPKVEKRPQSKLEKRPPKRHTLYLCSPCFLDEAFKKHAPETLIRMTLYERCDDPAPKMGHQQANTSEGERKKSLDKQPKLENCPPGDVPPRG